MGFFFLVFFLTYMLILYALLSNCLVLFCLREEHGVSLIHLSHIEGEHVWLISSDGLPRMALKVVRC